ncbi:MAG: leucyl aminopeptidase [Micrococcales bacterium]|nr:MAG: leucyl aminopeptidase [Micrococcales bacterium]PIE27608.1 MAG: leucyl aminopeptidase [Micrococcales bacterium]
MTSLSLSAKDPAGLNTHALVVLVGKGSTGPVVLAGALPKAARRWLTSALDVLAVTGAADHVTTIPATSTVAAKTVVLSGVGQLETTERAAGKAGTALPSREAVRRGVGAAVRQLAGRDSAAVVLPADTVPMLAAAAEGALLGAYVFNRYRTEPEPKDAVGSVQILSALARDKQARAALARAQVLAAAVHGARDLVNTPPLDLFPQAFADIAHAAAAEAGVSVSVLDEKQLKKDGYGGLTAVGQGSSRGPRLVRLEWDPDASRRGRARSRKHSAGPALALVGKGITFDSGGLSIKPAAGMETMKSDMAGAAAVLHTMLAIAALKLPVRVVGWLCLAENMPSGTAQRPSDVITCYGGRTVEVLNTDAEGRLVLADGIVAAGQEDPRMIVDVATLTGAQMIALGRRVSAIMSNDDALLARLHELADTAGEQFWPMPLPEELRASMDSPVADIANIGERMGGMLVAGLFLKEFVGTTGSEDAARQIPWAHLDIASPAFNEKEPHGYTPKGGTGVAVRTLVALAEHVAWQ